MRRILITTFLVISITTNIFALEKPSKNKCTVITNSSERLKCYDTAFGVVNEGNIENNVSLPNIIFSDSSEAVTVEILQVLLDGKIASKEKMHAFQINDAFKSGKRIIYFEFKITNNKYEGELHVSPFNFKLESASGETFSAKVTRDYITGGIHRGRSIRGSVAFEIFPESIPSVLRYDVGLRNSMGRLEAISPDLKNLVGLPK
jgi:hypothetical protein